MTEKINAQISAFVDDELPEEECTLLVKRVCTDNKLQGRVSRFALIGDVIRGDQLVADNGFSSRVSLAIDGEMVDQSASRRSPWRKWAKPISGFAVAATVAGVSLFSLQQSNNQPNALPSLDAAVVGGDSVTTLSPVQLPRFQLPEVRPASVMPQSRMDQYLLRHRGVATSVGGVKIMGMRQIGSEQINTNGVEGFEQDQAKPNNDGSVQ